MSQENLYKKFKRHFVIVASVKDGVQDIIYGNSIFFEFLDVTVILLQMEYNINIDNKLHVRNHKVAAI